MAVINYEVTWIDPESGVSFRIKDTFSLPKTLATVGPGIFSTTISLDDQAEHIVKVVPFNEAGEGPSSTGVAVHPAAPVTPPISVTVTKL